MTDTLLLVPATGVPVAVPRASWTATVDLLELREAFHHTVLDAFRQVPGIHVSDAQAAHLAWVAEQEAADPETPPADRAGLERLAAFCQESGGVLVAAPPEPVVAAGPAATAAAPAAPAEPPAWHARARRVLGPFAIILIAGAKYLTILKVALLAIIKFKFLATALSGVVSVGAYALFWGFPFAALFVLLLFVHEMGHVIALRREGIPITPVLFIPFMGAVVGMKSLPEDAWIEAKTAIAGPLLGTAGAVVVGALGEQLNSPLLSAAAYTGFLLNLFNLIPLTPLDGGRIVAAIHPFLWFAGLFGIALLTFAHPNGIFFLILFLGGRDAYGRYKTIRSGHPEALAYYRVSPRRRVAMAIALLGLAAFLWIAMQWTYVPR